MLKIKELLSKIRFGKASKDTEELYVDSLVVSSNSETDFRDIVFWWPCDERKPVCKNK